MPATGTTVEPVDAELHDAIDSFWKMYVDIGGRPGAWDPASARATIEQRATGAELEQLMTFFQGNTVSGYVIKGDVAIAPTVLSIDGDTATVHDCIDDTTGVYRTSDGSRIDTDNPERRGMVVTLQREGGVWKVGGIKNEGFGCTV